MERKDKMSTAKLAIIFIVVLDIICYLLARYYSELMKEVLAYYMMLIPASAVTIASFYSERKKLNIFNYAVSVFFIITSLLIFLYVALSTLDVTNFFPYAIVVYLGIFGSIVVIVNAFLQDDNSEMSIRKNYKTCLYCYALLVMIFVISGVVFKTISMDSFLSTIMPFLDIAFCCVAFLGEEYAWRGFFQEKFQKKFGKRIGVILLGILWETWHMPLWHIYYHTDLSGNLMRYFYVVSIGIFLGWAYMKTKNIWLCAIIHLCNNLFMTSLGPADSLNCNVLFKDTLLGYQIIFISVVFMLFLFSKEYRKDRNNN